MYSYYFIEKIQDRCVYTISCRSGSVQIGTLHLLRQETLEQFYLGYLGGCIRDSFRYLEWRNPEPYRAILGVGFPLHKPYPYS